MSLNTAKLKQDLIEWFSRPENIASVRQGENKFATVYHDYAKNAEDLSGDSVNNVTKEKFLNELDMQRSKTLKDFCRQIDTAFVAYWTGAEFDTGALPDPTTDCPHSIESDFDSETSSEVTDVETDAMYRALVTALSRKDGTAKTKAEQVAKVIDDVTRSAVTVVITGLDTEASPITNTCGVF